MSILRVIIDQIVAPVPGGIGRYAAELTRGLIATAPRGAHVEGVLSAVPDSDLALVADRLPGLRAIHKSAFDRRTLAAAWQHGFTPVPGTGMVHAMSLLAPLRRRRPGDGTPQTVVTIHDAVPWTHPETLTPRGVSWHRAMAKRAERYADAIVVPSHAVAAELGEVLDLGERVRVVGGAVGSGLALPDDAAARGARLALPERFVLSVGTLEPRKGIASLIAAMALLPDDIPLLVAGPAGWGELDVAAVASDAGLAEDRVRVLGHVSDPDLAVLLDRATVFAFPSLAEGFGLPVLEAMSLGTPVVHSDAPALLEISAGSTLVVERAGDGYADRLAEALRDVLEDGTLAARLATEGGDRARAFSWRDSAEKIWQLHADL